MGNKLGLIRKPLEQRFWEKVDKRSNNECWNWTASCSGNGYPNIRVGKKMVTASRVSYEIHNGPIDKGNGYHGICVCHKCDNPLCVNPKHLFLGTHQDNVTDRNLKNRTNKPIGETNGRAYLTEEDVRYIRFQSKNRLKTQKQLAKEFNTSDKYISRVVCGKIWKHV